MKLNKEQYRAAHHMDGPMLVLAGPGSGKTHLLVERIRIMIEDGHIPPENILVITFSKKAARQMQARFERRVEERSYPVTCGTFHAVFYHILREHNPNLNRLITEEEQRKFIALSAEKCALSSELFTKDENIGHIIGMIGAYKNFGTDMFKRNDSAKIMTEDERKEFEMLLSEYDRLCKENGVLDFDDMILLCHRLLKKHEMVLRKWQKKFRYFLVDEFQDINDLQYEVLRLLAGDSMNVFAVGDDDQSIYAFRGSKPQLMKKFLHQYVGCRQVTLTMNYRCCANIIGAADTLIRHNTDRLDRPMQRHLPSKKGGTVELINTENTLVQAAYVCDMISILTDEHGYKQEDIAVLYRSEHCATVFVKMAEERGYRLRSEAGSAGISRSRMIREAYIRAHDGTASRADYFLIMNNPPRGLSREALCPDTGNYIEAFRSYYADDPVMLEKVNDLEQMIRLSGVSEGTVLFDNFCENNNDFDDPWKSCQKEPSPLTPRGGINVMTAHASKGLEFPVVFIIGLQEGLFPHHKSMSDDLIEEERRLMYVAMTRAKERLYMCCVSTEHGKRASRFAVEATGKKQFVSDIIKLKRI